MVLQDTLTKQSFLQLPNLGSCSHSCDRMFLASGRPLHCPSSGPLASHIFGHYFRCCCLVAPAPASATPQLTNAVPCVRQADSRRRRISCTPP